MASNDEFSSGFGNQHMDVKAFQLQLEELFELDPGTIRPDQTLLQIEGWSSLTFVGLIALVDEEYGVMLGPADILACPTVGALAECIAGQMKGRAAA